MLRGDRGLHRLGRVDSARASAIRCLGIPAGVTLSAALFTSVTPATVISVAAAVTAALSGVLRRLAMGFTTGIAMA
jgi:hypothetical protein